MVVLDKDGDMKRMTETGHVLTLHWRVDIVPVGEDYINVVQL